VEAEVVGNASPGCEEEVPEEGEAGKQPGGAAGRRWLRYHSTIHRKGQETPIERTGEVMKGVSENLELESREG
jgi:hypothetical protein